MCVSSRAAHSESQMYKLDQNYYWSYIVNDFVGVLIRGYAILLQHIAMTTTAEIKEFLNYISGLKPPYECPVKGCGKVYKSQVGITNHLNTYDHECPENNIASKKPGNGSARKKMHWKKAAAAGVHDARSPTPDVSKKNARDPLTYAESQRLVEVEVGGEIRRISVYEPLKVISQGELDNCANTDKEEQAVKKEEVAVAKNNSKGKDNASKTTAKDAANNTDKPVVKLPQASFKVFAALQ